MKWTTCVTFTKFLKRQTMLSTFATFLYLVIYFVLFPRRKKMCDASINSILFLSVSGFCRKPNRRRPKTLRNSLNKFCICLCPEEELFVTIQLFTTIRTFTYRTLTSEMLVTSDWISLRVCSISHFYRWTFQCFKQVSTGLYICTLYTCL